MLQLDHTGNILEVGLDDCITINRRVSAANRHSHLRTSSAFGNYLHWHLYPKGSLALEQGQTTSAQKALELNAQASQMSTQVSDVTLQATQVLVEKVNIVLD